MLDRCLFLSYKGIKSSIYNSIHGIQHHHNLNLNLTQLPQSSSLSTIDAKAALTRLFLLSPCSFLFPNPP